MLLLSVAQVAALRQGRVSAALVPRSDTPAERRVRGAREIANPLRQVTREVVVRDEETGKVKRTVYEHLELTVTITAFVPSVFVADLDAKAARACGYETVELMRAEWKRRHPRMDLACLVYFKLGDHRDPDRYLTSTSSMKWDVGDGRGGTGDYTTNPRGAADDAAALTVDQLADLAKASRQKDLARLAGREAVRNELTEAERLAQLLALPPKLRKEIRQELRIIEQRAERGNSKID